VLLLNAVLTVEAHKAGSHGRIAKWEAFTDEVLRAVCRAHAARGVVFLLWGGYAKKKAKVVGAGGRHVVLTAAHPSPLAANRGGWFGCGHFRRVNQVLAERGVEPIDWTRTHVDAPPAVGS